MKKDMTSQQAFQKLAALCAKGEHCQHDMTEKMRQWGLGDEEQAEVMARLVNGHYVDDARYARAYVADKVRFGKWGRRKVEQGLWLKHIDQTIIDEALNEVDDSEYIEVLKPLLKQKRRTTKADSSFQLNGKLVKFAMGRGFTMDIIKQCIDVDDEDEFLA